MEENEINDDIYKHPEQKSELIDLTNQKPKDYMNYEEEAQLRLSYLEKHEYVVISTEEQREKLLQQIAKKLEEDFLKKKI